MAETLDFELVSPVKPLICEPVEMVVVPGSAGDFGVLPGHAPLLSTVRCGVIAIYSGGVAINRIFVAGGFAEIAEGRCTVLAEETMPLSELTREGVEAQLNAARDAVQEADEAVEKARAENRVAVAQAMLEALTV